MRMKKLLSRVDRYTNRLCFAALCVMVAYATLLGTGDFSRWMGGVNLWTAGLLVAVICAVPGILKDVKRIVKNPFLWILVAYALWNAVCLMVGICSGNEMGDILADVKSLIYFVLFPVILCAVNSRKRVHTLMYIAVWTSIGLGLCTCVLLWCYAIDRTWFAPLLELFLEGSFVNFTYISRTIPRILFVSAPFQLYGCAFSVYFLATDSKHRIPCILSCALALFAIVMTYTRALYLAAFAAAVLAVVLMLYTRRENWKAMVRGIAVSAVGCILLILCFSLAAKTNYFGFALQRVFVSGETNVVQTEPATEAATEPATEAITEPATEVATEAMTEPVTEAATEAVTEPVTEAATESAGLSGSDKYLNQTIISDGIRQRIKRDMMAILEAAPLTGSGLGTVLPDRVSAPEFSYLDVAIKSGWTGLVLYLLPVALMAVFLLLDLLKKRNVALSCIWAAALAGQMAYAIFQPYLFSGMAILLYCSTLAVYSLERNENRLESVE